MDHPHLRRTRLSAVTLLALGALVLVGCSGTSSRALIGSSTTVTTSPVTTLPAVQPVLQAPEGFRVPDTRNAKLLPAPSKALPVPVAVRGGRANLSGTVHGPDGDVGGAIVRIERFVGTASGTITVFADSGGRYNVAAVLGGRYRVRAWLAPTFTSVDSPTGFVAEDGNLRLDVGVERHDGTSLVIAPAVTALTVGVPVGVNGLITHESVDDNGIVHTSGLPGVPVLLANPGGLLIDIPNPAATDPGGRVRWTVTCQAPGIYPVSASAPFLNASIVMPACALPAPPPSSTTTTATPPTTPQGPH